MLGKGLQSLIPPQDDGENRSEEQSYAPQVPQASNVPHTPHISYIPNEPAVVQPPAHNTMNVSVPDSPSPVVDSGDAYGDDDMLPVPFHEIAVPMVQINQTPAANAPVFHRPTPPEPTWSPEAKHIESAPKPNPVSQVPPPAPAAAQNSVSQMPHTAFVPSKTPQLAHDVPEKYSEPIFHIETTKITSNPYQPRRAYNEDELRELASSIREYGVLQPLVVTRVEHETPQGTQIEYQLIAGERRLLASKIAGLERVPAIIKATPRDEREKLEMALIENVQRADLNPFDTARAYAKLQDQFGLSQREIAQRVGKSREVIANTIRLLQLPREAQTALTEGKINESHARILLSVADPATQRAALDETLSKGLSVRELQTTLAAYQSGEPMGSAVMVREQYDPEAEFVRQRLEEALGARVKVVKKGRKGKITINFFSDEELNSIMKRFSGGM
jgi:ParB family chromosome partitioning protein